MAAHQREQEQARGDVDDVVPAVDLKDDEVVALDAAAGLECRLGDEAQEPDQHKGGAYDKAEDPRWRPAEVVVA